MRTKVHYIKSSLLAALLVIESYLLSDLLMGYVMSGNFFSPSPRLLIKAVAMLLLILYTYFLTVGGWGKWEQYLTVSLPIATGIGIRATMNNPTYGLLIGFLVFLILSYDVFLSNRLKNHMLVFNPRIILKFSNRGVLFTFALSTAIFVFIDKPVEKPEFNLGAKIGNITQRQFENILEPQLNQSAKQGIAEQIPGGGDDFIQGLPDVNLDLRQTIETEFNKIVEPYKRFIPPLIALVVFTFVRFLGGITNWIFTFTIGLVFAFFKKIKFLHVNHKTVQKEEIGFESETE